MTPSLIYFIIDFLVIFLAVVIADIVIISVKSYSNRALDIGCDYCEEIKPLVKTPDKKFYLCRKCFGAYITENDGKFSEEQINKATRGFRKIKRKGKKK